MTRFVPVTLVVMVVVLAASRVAGAQATGGLPGGATVVFEHRQIYDDNKKDGSFIEPQAGSTQLLHYFNLAHCNCARANLRKPKTVGTFNYLVRETALSGVHFGVDFWTGTTCEDQAHRTGTSITCVPLDSIGDVDNTLYPGGVYENFNLYQVVNLYSSQNPPVDPNTLPKCMTLDNVSNSIFALIDTKGGTNYDYSASQVTGGLSGETGTASGVDTKPPPLPEPTSIKAVGIDEGVRVSWTPPAANNTDIAYYQALCANVDGTPALKGKSHDAQFVTTASLCAAGGDPALTAKDLNNLDQGETSVPAPDGGFGALDEEYVCGQSNPGTADSLAIKGLANGTPYRVILLSIDLHGNYSGTYFTSTVTPVPSTDFWEDLHDRGSKVEGGLCLLAETYGDDSGLTNALRAFRDDTLGTSRAGRWLTDAYYATLARLGGYVHGSIVLRVIAGVVLAPLVALALLWHWLTLPGLVALLAAAWWWRRRRDVVIRGWHRIGSWRWIRLAAGLAIVIFGAGRAHAGGYEPYWEDQTANDQENRAAADEASLVKWHVGIRVGPYVPEIDKQFGVDPGPYRQAFGGSRILPMLDVDRMLWTGFGQVGVGISLGYMQKFAHTFTNDSQPTDDPRDRAADTNTFRLIPAAVTATYRFTWLDDQYGVPVVPYVRGGLSYYVWWLSLSDGSFAKACKAGSTGPACSTTRALGASLGVQGSIGLAIRAERIDAATAMSMRNSGIEHAGIYGELSLAKVDGFGSDKKLSVGDRTWFAGVDFEF